MALTVDTNEAPQHVLLVRGTYAEMARIEITPTWAKLMDFETRVPDLIEKLMRRQQRGGRTA